MKTRFLIVSAAALALAACGSDDAAEAPVAEDTAAAAADAGAPDPATPQGFVATAASSDMYEIQAGQMAQEMAKRQDVKDFGAMMEKDHTASSEKLKKAVAEAGTDLTVPADMLPKHQQQLDALRMAGDNFDSVYLQQQMIAHQEALTLLQTQAQSGTVGSLKAFAAEAAPVVQGHLKKAEQVAGGASGGDDAATDAGAAE